MNEQQDVIENTPTKPKEMDRRQLLTQLGATGLVGASLLADGGWRKPVVQAAALPPHAQVSPAPTSTTVPTVYAMQCDSTPGGGDITAGTDFCIAEVAARVLLVTGTGPVVGIPVSLTCSNPAVTFVTPPPASVPTDATGRASFGSLCVMADGLSSGTTFNLVFSCVDPVNGGTLSCNCGTYRIFKPRTIESCGWTADSYETYVNINPPGSGISMSVEIFDSGTDASLETGSGTTDAAGHVTYSTEVYCGDHPTVYAVWSFTNSGDGTGTCATANYILPC